MQIAVELRFGVGVVVDEFGVDPRVNGVGLLCGLILRGRVVSRVGDGLRVERFGFVRARVPLSRSNTRSNNRRGALC
ncbi:hypothetical protein A5784_32800 [Mycobacterium sp. 852013-50091_SCH5140682]|nr:hypothetical protein A5784_32800 [Mycobacterium sp. 852013-50091_SCH5140682]